MPLLARRPRRALTIPRRLLACLMAAAVVGGCAAGEGASASRTATPPSAAPVASGGGPAADCNPDALQGWPTAGQVTTTGIIPVLASSEKVVGKSRLLFVLIDDQNTPVANEALGVQISFFDLCADPTTPTEVLTPAFEWGIVGSRAFYVVTPSLAEAGPWGAAVTVKDPATGKTNEARLQFSVAAGGTGPRVGDAAPPVKTPTAADVGGDVSRVSSDPQPEPSFYQTSLDAALAAKAPFVLAFITPAFCKSAQCGPTMEVLKKAVKDAPIRVVAVEPYQLVYEDGRLQPVLQDGNFVPVEATEAYGIPSEPWIFIVDRAGTIASSFEAVVGQEELADAVRAVTK